LYGAPCRQRASCLLIHISFYRIGIPLNSKRFIVESELNSNKILWLTFYLVRKELNKWKLEIHVHDLPGARMNHLTCALLIAFLLHCGCLYAQAPAATTTPATDSKESKPVDPRIFTGTRASDDFEGTRLSFPVAIDNGKVWVAVSIGYAFSN
jgi:hypothetical protein